MRVWLQEVDDTCRDGVRAGAIQCDHTECFPDDPEEAARVGAILDVDDQAYVGGGAAQLYLLTRVSTDPLARFGDALPCPVCGGVLEGNTCCPPPDIPPMKLIPLEIRDGHIVHADVDDGDYIAERIEQRDDTPPTPFDDERSYSDIVRDGMDE